MTARQTARRPGALWPTACRIVLLSTSLIAAGQSAVAQEVIVRKMLTVRFPQSPPIDEVTPTQIPGLYKVRSGSIVFYTDRRGDYIIPPRRDVRHTSQDRSDAGPHRAGADAGVLQAAAARRDRDYERPRQARARRVCRSRLPLMACSSKACCRKATASPFASPCCLCSARLRDHSPRRQGGARHLGTGKGHAVSRGEGRGRARMDARGDASDCAGRPRHRPQPRIRRPAPHAGTPTLGFVDGALDQSHRPKL